MEMDMRNQTRLYRMKQVEALMSQGYSDEEVVRIASYNYGFSTRLVREFIKIIKEFVGTNSQRSLKDGLRQEAESQS